MVITFARRRKIQKYLSLVLGIIILVTIFIFWLGFFKKEKIFIMQPLPEFIPKKIEINFQVLKSSIFQELQPFPERPLLPSEEEMGRENPFLPY